MESVARENTFIETMAERVLARMERPCGCKVPIIRLRDCPTCLRSILCESLQMMTPTHYIDQAGVLIGLDATSHPLGVEAAKKVVMNQRTLLRRFRSTMQQEIRRIDELLPRLKAYMRGI